MNTHPNEVNPNDEIGYKLNSMYQVNEKLDINGSFAISSRHNGNSVIPEFDDEYLPYQDIWLGSNFVEESYGITAGAGYFVDFPPEKPDTYSDERTTFMGEYFIRTDGKQKIVFCGEFQTVSNDYLSEDYNDIYASAEYSYSPLGYLSISMIKTSQDVSGDAPDMWLGLEAGFDIRDNHKLELFYGRERAGVKCSGGTCRQVPEFDGFRMTLISQF